MANTGTLFDLPSTDPKTGEVLAVVETLKGSRNKYSFDRDWGVFRLGGVLPEGMSFPYDFGFIPSTLGEDGDALDVLILLDAPATMGCVLTIRLLGLIEAEQTERDGETMRNDRLIATATHAHTHEHITSIDDLPGYLPHEIESFFVQYNQLQGRRFKLLGQGSVAQAQAIVEGGRAALAHSRR